jgi:hypothetical protein
VIVVALVAAAIESPAADSAAPPSIHKCDSIGTDKVIPERSLYSFELNARKRFAEKDAPDDVIVFARSSPIEFRVDLDRMPDSIEEVLVVSISGDHGELEWSFDYGEKHEKRKLSKQEVRAIRQFISNNAVDKLPPLEASRVVRGEERIVLDGINYVYVHLNAKSGRRVNINNPPEKGESEYPADDPSWKYSKVVDFFNGLKPKGKVADKPSAAQTEGSASPKSK